MSALSLLHRDKQTLRARSAHPLCARSGRKPFLEYNLALADMQGEDLMPAYLIAEHKITDTVKFEEYRSKVAPMITQFGGRYLTRGGSHKILEKGY